MKEALGGGDPRSTSNSRGILPKKRLERKNGENLESRHRRIAPIKGLRKKGVQFKKVFQTNKKWKGTSGLNQKATHFRTQDARTIAKKKKPEKREKGKQDSWDIPKNA